MENFMTNNNEENFNMQQLMNITGQTAMNVNNMSKQLGIMNTAIGSLTADVDTMKNDITQLKENEEITTTQQENINHMAKEKVLSILGKDPLEVQKYMRTFIQKLYSDTRRYAGLGSKIARTKKCDYQRCVDFIDAWVPNGGYTALKEKADRTAAARLKAKELGYVR